MRGIVLAVGGSGNRLVPGAEGEAFDTTMPARPGHSEKQGQLKRQVKQIAVENSQNDTLWNMAAINVRFQIDHRNGTMAITSISTSISGQASWLTLRNVCAGSGALP